MVSNKTERYEFRCTKEFKQLLTELTDKLKIPASDFIIMSVTKEMPECMAQLETCPMYKKMLKKGIDFNKIASNMEYASIQRLMRQQNKQVKSKVFSAINFYTTLSKMLISFAKEENVREYITANIKEFELYENNKDNIDDLNYLLVIPFDKLQQFFILYRTNPLFFLKVIKENGLICAIQKYIYNGLNDFKYVEMSKQG